MTTETKPKVRLTGRDGNVFAIFGACRLAARKAGWSDPRIDAVIAEMKAGDYDHVLQVALREFDVS